MSISEQRRREVIDALRRGTVPRQGLDVLAVGLSRFEAAVDDDLDRVAAGQAVFKAVRGEYGAGKTFFSRWLAERAKRKGLATTEVQISENETPLHRLQTVFRRLTEHLSTAEFAPSAFRPVVDSWFFALEEDVLAAGDVPEDELERRVTKLLEERLAVVSRVAPSFAAALRGYRRASVDGDSGAAEGLLAWLGGQPHVGASVKHRAGIRGDLDHDGALGFLQGLLAVLRDGGHTGLLVVLDEVETLQRVRSDVRDKALNALRQLVDDVDSGRFPGLMLVVTGTPAFFDGPQGMQRLAPLAQRLHVDFSTSAVFDNPRAVQIRLPGFDKNSLLELGSKVRDLYMQGSPDRQRLAVSVDDGYVADLARAVTGHLGNKVGVAPRIFVKKVVDVLDRVDQHPTFDPRRDYALRVTGNELTEAERGSMPAPPPLAPAASVDEIDLQL
ncbi:BREX system ATP-binding protein BrxD [Actinopolymorpha sp. B17G11]|uniref:BREX system ATP-binding protein BrxD n=1 Tax=Actinopolymorpha sp. B17G11 TaxID=3160861 RepID=UPI0032E3E0EE